MAISIVNHGIYTFSEAAQLADVGARRVRAWFQGRTLASKRLGRGQVLQGDHELPGAISFLDLIETVVVGQMREMGISLIAIRKAHNALQNFLKTNHPFCHQDLLTDGRKLFVYLEAQTPDQGELVEVVSRQHAIPKILLPYLRRIDYDRQTRMASRWNIREDVVIDPSRSMGKPIAAKSAIPTAILSASYFANGKSLEHVADWYAITVEDVQAAVSFEECQMRAAAA